MGVSWKKPSVGTWDTLLSGVVLALLVLAAVVARTADAGVLVDSGSDSKHCYKMPRHVPHLVPQAEVQDGNCLVSVLLASETFRSDILETQPEERRLVSEGPEPRTQ